MININDIKPIKNNAISKSVLKMHLLFLAVGNVVWVLSLFFRNVTIVEISTIIAVTSAINLVDISIDSGINHPKHMNVTYDKLVAAAVELSFFLDIVFVVPFFKSLLAAVQYFAGMLADAL